MIKRQDQHRLVRGAYITLLIFAVLAVLQMGLLGVNKLRGDRPILGLRFEGALIGGLPDAWAQKRITTTIHEYQNMPMTVRAQHFTSHATLSRLGLYVSDSAVRQEVNRVGHTGTLWHKMWQQNMALLGLLNVRLRPAVNQSVATSYVTQMQQAINMNSVDASYALVGKTVTVTPDTNGLTIPLAQALQRLAAADPLRDTPIILPLSHPEAPVTATMLQVNLPKMQNMAAQPLTVTAAGYSAVLSPADIVAAVVPKVTTDPSNPSKKTAQLTFDEAKLAAVANGVMQQATIKPQAVIIRSGEVVRQGKDGRKPQDNNPGNLVVAALTQRQSNAAADPSVDLPMVVDKAPVVYESTPIVRTSGGGGGSGGVHLTFDDGPGAYTQQVLDILARYNVHATFYVIGKNVVAYPADVRRMAAEGQEIGNHSWSHANLATLSWSGVYQELSSTQIAVQQTAGVTPTKFRPPYGAVNNTVRNAAASLGLSVNLWSIDTVDWSQPGTNTIIRRALTGDHNGSVILLHVLHAQTVNALPSIIEGIRAQGYTIN
ncbi:MAG TPA: polysaccharide deacetylase family protein [Candidatus Saccharimonadales bacterium]|nr:polysaccharide deacetylase family protein [Candidatus Saccharimonadales bacterium]